MFKQDAWNDLIKEIQQLDDSTEKFTLRIENAGVRRKLEEIHSTLSNDQLWRNTSARDEKMKQFYKLLYTCPYKDRKDRNSPRVPGTCEWFTSHTLFQAWEQSDHSALLWVSADPGCGKSVLTRYLIDEFLALKPKRTVCYFFFKDDFSDQKSGANALSAVLRQFFMARPHLLSDTVLGKLDSDGKNLVESLSDLWNILLDVTTNPEAGEVICVLDALDECQDADRKQLIQALGRFYLERPDKHNLKVLVTSRPYEHIRRGFQKLENQLPTIHLSGEEEVEIQKISHEIDLVIEKRVEDIGKENDLRPDECVFLKDQLTSVPNRTYLWVSLTLEVIENMPGFTKGNIRYAIRNLPQNVDEAYEKILNRSPDKPHAKRLLHIVTAAERPLSLRELSVAMTVDAGLQSLIELKEEFEADEELHDRRFRRTMRELCGLFLVTVDERIYLLHQTAKEFLVKDGPSNLAPPDDSVQSVTAWKHCLQPEESHRVLVEACMLYLTYDGMTDSLPCFLNYAACHWPSHFRKAFKHEACEAHKVHEAAKLGYFLCQPESKIYQIWSSIFRPSIPTHCNTVTIATYLGLAAVVKLHLQSTLADVDSKDPEYGRTPLCWAAHGGHAEVVQLLLETGKVDVNTKDLKNEETPLSCASWLGHEVVVKLLLATQKVDVESRDSYGQTPLTYASRYGYEAISRLLLETQNAGVNSKDTKHGQTPLIWAAEYGREAVVKLLLDREADVNLKDSAFGQAPLLWAAEKGRKEVVELLLETQGVNIDSRNDCGETALHLAAEKGHEAVVELLLNSEKLDVQAYNRFGKTALHMAAKKGCEAVVKVFLSSKKVDLNARTEFGETARDLAMEGGHKAVVELLG
jgi:ankyrin repeat protein